MKHYPNTNNAICPYQFPNVPKTDRKSVQNNCILLEQLIDEVQCSQQLCISAQLCRPTAHLKLIEHIEYDHSIQYWDSLQSFSTAYTLPAIQATLYTKDTCGHVQILNAAIQLSSPLLRIENCPPIHDTIAKLLLLIEIHPLSILAQQENTLQFTANVCMHGFLTCIIKYPFPAPHPTPCCQFSPLYPNPCLHPTKNY